MVQRFILPEDYRSTVFLYESLYRDIIVSKHKLLFIIEAAVSFTLSPCEIITEFWKSSKNLYPIVKSKTIELPTRDARDARDNLSILTVSLVTKVTKIVVESK